MRIEALGAVDELNSMLGWALVAWQDAPPLFRDIQVTLFDIGAELATPPARGANRGNRLCDTEVEGLETCIDAIESRLPPLQQFILPGGSEAAARLHMVRSVARRAERQVLHLHRLEPVHPTILQYLNRLSDLLFVAAREANRTFGQADVPYRPRVKD